MKLLAAIALLLPMLGGGQIKLRYVDTGLIFNGEPSVPGATETLYLFQGAAPTNFGFTPPAGTGTNWNSYTIYYQATITNGVTRVSVPAGTYWYTITNNYYWTHGGATQPTAITAVGGQVTTVTVANWTAEQQGAYSTTCANGPDVNLGADLSEAVSAATILITAVPSDGTAAIRRAASGTAAASITVTCSDVGPLTVEGWVKSNNNLRQDYCTTFITVIDDTGGCS